jgi:hypothetical protein
MILKESVSMEVVGLVKAHGILPKDGQEYEELGDQIIAELVTNKGDFEPWFAALFGRDLPAQEFQASLKGYWDNWLSKSHVI